MALTKEFRQTVVERARRDESYRRAMLIEAIDSFLEGETDVGRLMLRDYINATIGFDELALLTSKRETQSHADVEPRRQPNRQQPF